MDDFYFIAHLLDRVLVGRKDDGRYYQQLLHGVRDDTALEIRIFNEKEERYAARVCGQMVIYKPLKHDSSRDKVCVIDRCYRLEEGFPYKTLHVKEYIAIDECHHAYVEKCVLYRLSEKEDYCGEIETEIR